MKITSEKIEQTKVFAEQFTTLTRPSIDLVGWIALKFSCTRSEALRLIEAAGL